jgi:hypothetical protein
MNMKSGIRLLGILVGTALLFSCATAPSGAPSSSGQAAQPQKAAAPSASETPMYYATGSGASQLEAMNSAKMNAVRKAVQDAIGLPAAMAKKAQVEELFSNDKNANTYVINSSTEILDRSGQDGSFTVTLGVRINLEAVSNVLRSNDIYGNLVLPQGGKVVLADQEPPSFVQPAAGASDEGGPAASAEGTGAGVETGAGGQPGADASVEAPLDPQKAAIVQSILDNLVYMVYFDEENVADPFLAKTAVGMANKFLSQQGMEYVDLEQIEKIKEDQMNAYEAETGQAVSMIQWIAGKLNADIYIEITLDTTAEQKNGRYYGSASVTLKNFDSSTGAGRGTAFYQTVPPAMSTVSMDDAVNNAVASATYKAMEEALKQAQNYTEKELRQGIKYEVVLQNTSDARAMRDFVKKMERKVESISRLSYSPAEAKYEVRLIGKISDLEDIVYDVCESVDGLEGIFLVYQRGNSITFDTGM